VDVPRCGGHDDRVSSQPLVIGTYPANRLLPLPPVPPGARLVVTYPEPYGDPLEPLVLGSPHVAPAGPFRRVFDRRPSREEREGGLQIDVVDVRPHRVSGTLTLPARGDVYQFTVRVTAIWYAARPHEVVGSHIANPHTVVLEEIDHLFRRVTRTVHADEAEALELRLNETVDRPRPVPPDTGLDIVSCRARVRLDERRAERWLQFDTNEIDRQQENYRRDQEREQVRHLRELVGDNSDAVFLHLARHPEDTAGVLEHVLRTYERDHAAGVELLERLLAKGRLRDQDPPPRQHVLEMPPDAPWPGRRQAQAAPPAGERGQRASG
jgi:hypothetical protein